MKHSIFLYVRFLYGLHLDVSPFFDLYLEGVRCVFRTTFRLGMARVGGIMKIPILKIPIFDVWNAPKTMLTDFMPTKKANRAHFCALFFYGGNILYACSSKASLSSPQMGQTKSSGISSHLVPGAMPFSGSPLAGSYS